MHVKLLVDTIEAAGQRQPPPLLSGQLAGKAGTILSSWLAAAARWHRVRRAVQEVARLDDRMLKDIGIHRSEIESAVRWGRAPLRTRAQIAGRGSGTEIDCVRRNGWL